MTSSFARYRHIAALADEPTPLRRLIAAAVAGAIAFGVVQLFLGFLWGAGASAVLFSSFALAVAAAAAAAGTRPAMAAAYGILGAVWLLLECFVLVLGCIAAAFG